MILSIAWKDAACLAKKLDEKCESADNQYLLGTDGRSGVYRYDSEEYLVVITRFGNTVFQVEGDVRANKPQDQVHFSFGMKGKSVKVIEGLENVEAYIESLLEEESDLATNVA